MAGPLSGCEPGDARSRGVRFAPYAVGCFASHVSATHCMVSSKAARAAASANVVNSMSEIAARLGVVLGALGHGPRDAPARQQTLRATLDWSHALLDDSEQTCFARFAVFAGGATVEAAQTITGADLDTLDRLVAKSLLVRRQNAYGPTRLAMLETVKAYAAERFAALADSKAVHEDHF